jgi:hypothetical protein
LCRDARVHQHLFHRAHLNDVAAEHNRDAVADVIGGGQVVGDIEHAHAQIIAQLLNRLTIDMRSEASTIETGSSAINSLGLVNNARAIEMRCSCPPENSLGYFPANSHTSPHRFQLLSI